MQVKPGESAPARGRPPAPRRARRGYAADGVPRACRPDRSASAAADDRRRADAGAPRPPATRRGTRRPPPAGTTGVTGSNQLIGEKDFNTCKKFPAGKRIVKLNLKPDTELGDLDRLDLVDHLQAVPAARHDPGEQQEGHGRRARADHAGGGLPAVPGRARFGGPDRRALGQVRAHRRDREDQDDGRHPGLRRGRRRPDRARATSPAWSTSRTSTRTRWRRCSAASRASRATSSSSRPRTR